MREEGLKVHMRIGGDRASFADIQLKFGFSSIVWIMFLVMLLLRLESIQHVIMSRFVNIE